MIELILPIVKRRFQGELKLKKGWGWLLMLNLQTTSSHDDLNESFF
jgi:hypothetical protein